MKPILSPLAILPVFSMIVINTAEAQDLEDAESRDSKLPHYLRDDGIKRVIDLDRNNFDRTLKQSKMLVLLFYLSSRSHPDSEKLWKSDRQMLEVVARILQPQGVTVAAVNVAEEYELAQKLGVKFSGAISVFHRGKRVEYYGHRSADVLVTFLHKMFDPPVTNIDNKKQRTLLEDAEGTKVVGYFDLENPQFKEFEEAAKNFQPLIPFYVVTDKKPIKEKNINKFVQSNKRQIITKIRLEDIHETWSSKVEGYLVTAFVKPKTIEGAQFFSLVRSLAKAYKSNEKLSFVWVDPDPFPMMRDYWQKSYRIDVSSPAVGVVDPKLNKSTWFKKKGKETKLRHLQEWMKDVLANKTEFLPASTDDEPASTQKQEL
ncbi:predicted protein [Nematostella vectensis]|uniref:Calsequestrin n=1 Tax=Nematostella vectensis TaxID=45351 RepID=A7SY15_NEMVE|nr:predicted protein [Nematostella vectensis]|eukprot:XP_001623501.1 predicted protein [Nematostella vectensis]